MRSPAAALVALLIALLAVVVGGLAWVSMRPAGVIPSQPSTVIADGSLAAVRHTCRGLERRQNRTTFCCFANTAAHCARCTNQYTGPNAHAHAHRTRNPGRQRLPPPRKRSAHRRRLSSWSQPKGCR